MTFQAVFNDWSKINPPLGLYSRCSPNLARIREHVEQKWGLTSLGCHHVRTKRGAGESLSAHAWGAAIDLSYAALGRERAVEEVLPWLIAHSEGLHVQAIHDYVGCRIWRAGRTLDQGQACSAWWKAQRPDAHGMGSSWATWFHVETTSHGWSDHLTLARRGIT